MATVPQTQPDTPTQETTLAALILILLSGEDEEQSYAAVQASLAEHGVRPDAARIAAELVLPHAPDLSAQRVLPRTALHHVTRTGVARQAAQLVASATRMSIALDDAGVPPPREPPGTVGTAGPGPGDAGRHIAATADERRALFGQRSSERIGRAVQAPEHQFPAPTEALDRQLASERRFFGQHLAAERARREAARRVDRLAAQLQVTRLGWHSQLDGRTTPACRAAHGHNFDVARPPALGYPGTPHGGTCRCRPVAPFPGRSLVDELVLPSE